MYDDKDPPLTENGKHLATQVGLEMKEYIIGYKNGIYSSCMPTWVSSPLIRTIQTGAYYMDANRQGQDLQHNTLQINNNMAKRLT